MSATMAPHSFLMLAVIFLACLVQCLPEGLCFAYQAPAQPTPYEHHTSSEKSVKYNSTRLDSVAMSTSSIRSSGPSHWNTSTSTIFTTITIVSNTSSVNIPSLVMSPVFVTSSVISPSFTTSGSATFISTTSSSSPIAISRPSSSANVSPATVGSSSYSLTLVSPASASSDSPIKQDSTTKYWNGWNNVHFLFTFGDSYTSTVFDIHGQQPNPSNPLGNPPYPGSTSCNGPNWVDFLTTTYNQSYIQTYNMAFGGAVVDSSLVGEIFPMVVQDLQQQVADEFIPIYSNKTIAPWTSSNSLFAIFIGVNDIGNAYGRHNTTLNGDIFVVYSRLVDQLYQTGARNFLFLNVPPIDRSPGTTVQGASPEQVEAADVGDFNSRVANMARNLSTTYLDTTVYQFDTNLLYTQILDNPASHTQTAGYKNTTSYCASYQDGTPTTDYLNATCGIPVNQYFWLNNLHPTYPMHNATASEIVHQLQG